MKKRTTGKRSLALLLCAVMACASLYSPVSVWASVIEELEEEAVEDAAVEETDEDVNDEPTVDNSEQIADLQNQLNQISQNLEQYQNEQNRLQAEINAAQSNKAEAEAVRDNYGQQITLTEKELSALRQRIDLLLQDIAQKEKQIEEKQKEIDEKQKEIDEYYALFKERLRAQYMQDTGSILGLLLGADSFSSFLSHAETVNRIAQHDRDLMQKLTEERKKIEQTKTELEEAAAQLEASKVQLEADKAEVQKKNDALAVQYQQAQSDVQDLAKMEAEFMADLAANKAKQQQMQNEINSLYQQIEFTQNPYAGGEMAWPLPGFSTISSSYGWRFGGSDFHTGMDITGSGCHGANIVAANDGVVSFVNTTYSPGVGYGIYVIIDHGVKDGNSISTLYAHCSAIYVTVGQTVKRGQAIAAVGSTGWSTGPHVHFEVRINGSHVNPAGYVS